jgi:nucleoside-diphosphate-sugar epimerase
MRVLIFGGTAFIGPWVVRRLVAEGHEVAVFHRGRREADLPDGVVHIHGDRDEMATFHDRFAAFRPDVALDMRPLRESDIRAVQAAVRGVAGRLVAVSSCDVYRAYGVLIGLEQGPVEPTPVTEDSPLRTALYPYRASAAGEEDLRYWYDKIPAERACLDDSELPGTVLRLPMVHGPGDYQHRLHPYVRRVEDGRPRVVLPASLASWRTCRGYVENVADAIALACADERAAGRVYNVADPVGYAEAEWARKVTAAMGWNGEIVVAPDDRLPSREDARYEQDLTVDTGRIRRELGYVERVGEAEALRRTIEWERANPRENGETFDYDAEDAACSEWPAA